MGGRRLATLGSLFKIYSLFLISFTPLRTASNQNSIAMCFIIPTRANNLPPFPAHSQGKTNADPTGLGTSNVNASKHIAERNQGSDNDPNLNELKATTNNGVDAGNLTIHFQQAEISTGNSYLDAQSMGDCIQSGRCRGAKRRKSGPVKRFKKETCACESVPVDTQNTIHERGWRGENAGYVGNNSHKMIGW